MAILESKFRDRIDQFAFPPPVFMAMQGEFIQLDLEAGLLTTRFPVLPSYLNPYGTMQGGMIAAAVDNTLGPLSVLVAPPNVTRHLELKYSLPITTKTDHIFITAKFLDRDNRRLFFEAVVRDKTGLRLARAKADHWIIEGPEE